MGPFVWYYGQRMLTDIDENANRVDGRETIAVGRTLGAVASLLVLPLIVVPFALL